MPPNNNQASAPVAVSKKKTPILVQLAAVVLILPTALGLFAVGSSLLSGFDLMAAIASAVFVVILVGAFGIFSMKRWALYTATAGEVIALGILLIGGAIDASSVVSVVALIVCWVYYKSFM